MSNAPWLAAVRMDAVIYEGLRTHLALQTAALYIDAGKDAKDFEAVLLARGGARELELLQKLLEREEKDNVARRKYDGKRNN